jgi:predicted transcriptional regulator
MKEKLDRNLNVRCCTQDLDDLETISERLDRSKGWIVRKALNEYYENHKLDGILKKD